MKYKFIDMDNYPRASHYNHYCCENNCTYSVNVKINVGHLVQKVKEKGQKFYPAMIALVAKAVNCFDEFKMTVVDNKLAVHEKVSPSYLIFHQDDKTFSCCYSEYNEDFNAFYANIVSDMEKFKNVKGFKIMEIPTNTFPVSVLPWVNYESLNINVSYCKYFYAPIITWGKYDENFEMTFTVQIDHAVADGYHTSTLINKVQELIFSYE